MISRGRSGVAAIAGVLLSVATALAQPVSLPPRPSPAVESLVGEYGEGGTRLVLREAQGALEVSPDGRAFEPVEENPMIGFRGASRYYDDRYRAGFALECQAIRRVRDVIGLDNVLMMIPFCRTVMEGRKVQAEMASHGLVRGQDELEIYVMCEIPSNVILAEEFSEIFDGFSIGSNDLTQLILGVDRDSEIVAHVFDERNDAVKRMISSVIHTAHKMGRKIGICGQAPSDYPEFAAFLVQEGIDSLSLSSDAVLRTTLQVAELEKTKPT